MLLVPVMHLAKRRLASTGHSPTLTYTEDGALVWLSGGQSAEAGDGAVVPAKLKMDQLQLLWHYGIVGLGNPSGVVHKVFRGRNALMRHLEANAGGVGVC